MIQILDQLAYKVANLVHAWLDIVAAEMRYIMASESDAKIANGYGNIPSKYPSRSHPINKEWNCAKTDNYWE